MAGGKIPTTSTRLDSDFVFFHREPYGLRQPSYIDGIAKKFAMTAKEFFAFIPHVTKNVWMPASAARAPGIKPATYVDHGISGAWSFADGAEEIIHANIMVPDDMDLSEDSIICLGWSSTTISQDCDWEIAYLITAVDGDTTAAAEDTVQSYEESSSVAEGMVKSEFCVIAGGTIVAGDVCLHVQVMRDGNDGSDNLGAAAEVHGIMLKYVANKLGT